MQIQIDRTDITLACFFSHFLVFLIRQESNYATKIKTLKENK